MIPELMDMLPELRRALSEIVHAKASYTIYRRKKTQQINSRLLSVVFFKTATPSASKCSEEASSGLLLYRLVVNILRKRLQGYYYTVW